MDKNELLKTLSESRYELDRALADVVPSEMTTPGIVGEWSIKDIIAHITWAVKETVGMLEAKALVGSPLWRLTEEERNTAVYEQNRERPLQEVLSDSQQAHRRLIDLVTELPEEELLQAEWFAGLPGGEWPPWQVIQVNVSNHYSHHTQDIRSWFTQSAAP
jgi:hypothetical protein